MGCRLVAWYLLLTLLITPGNIRIGDYILIIDSDTRVPRDCMLDSVSEMEHNPNCGIMQHASGVMNVTDCMVFILAITT